MVSRQKRRAVERNANKEGKSLETQDHKSKKEDSKVSRRKFLKIAGGAGLILAGGLAVGLLPSTSLEQRVLNVCEEVAGSSLEHNFYEGSRDISIFFPETHSEEYREISIPKIKQVQQKLRQEDIKLAGLGLEGFTHGIYDTKKIQDLKKSEEQFNRSVSKIAEEVIEKIKQFRIINKSAPLPIDLIDEIPSFISLLMNPINDFSFVENDTYFHGIPGLQNAYAINLNYFGLENYEALKTALLVSCYAQIIYCRSTFERIFADTLKKDCKPLYDYFNSLLDQQSEIKPKYAELMPKDLKLKIDSLDPASKELDKYITSEFFLDERTKHWVNAAPMEGVVIVVGGKMHTEPYKRFSKEKGAPHIIMPYFQV